MPRRTANSTTCQLAERFRHRPRTPESGPDHGARKNTDRRWSLLSESTSDDVLGLWYRSKVVSAPAVPLSVDAQTLKRTFPSLKVLVLHGSRARGQAHERSDWDFAYLAEDNLDLPGLILELSRLTGSDDVDVADLARASGLLRHRVSTDGKLIFERSL